MSDSTEAHVARVKRVEGLRTERALLNFLIDQYESFPAGYPGGYSQLRLDYPAHLQRLDKSVASRELGIGGYIARAFPNKFLSDKGVRDIVSQRREFGEYALSRLEPIDAEYYERVQATAVALKPRQVAANEAKRLAARMTDELAGMQETHLKVVPERFGSGLFDDPEAAEFYALFESS